MSKPNIRDLNLRVTGDNLLEEWQGQASLMLEYGIELADAQLATDQAKAQLAVKASELDREIRETPEDYGLAKATETTVPGCVAEQPEHKVATRKYLDAKHKTSIFKAAVDAISHRKSTLQGMTDLWLRQYYADPTTREQPEELKDAADKTEKTIARHKGRRRRRAETGD